MKKIINETIGGVFSDALNIVQREIIDQKYSSLAAHAAQGNLVEVQNLLKELAELEEVKIQGEPTASLQEAMGCALWYACKYTKNADEERKLEVCKYLLQKADINFDGSQRETNFVPVSIQVGETPLINAISAGYEKIALYLIGRGADVLSSNFAWHGYTPLMEAVRQELPSVVLALIKKGADINDRNEEDEFPQSALELLIESWEFKINKVL